jgi:hypothetical protein
MYRLNDLIEKKKKKPYFIVKSFFDLTKEKQQIFNINICLISALYRKILEEIIFQSYMNLIDIKYLRKFRYKVIRFLSKEAMIADKW